MTWLAGQRSDLAADHILDTAAALFAEDGLDGPGMAAIADAAGCSRATLYRYFPDRRTLQVAFARREAAAILEEVRGSAADPAGIVLACLRAVRARPYLAAWYATSGTGELSAILHEAGIPAGREDPDLAAWLLRVVLSFLADPAPEDDERRLLERFLAT